MSRGTAGCGAGVAAVAGVAAASVAARHADPADSSPLFPQGNWSSVWLWGILGALAMYGLGVFLVRGSPRLGLVIAVAVVLQGLPLAAPLLLSRDAYAYWSQARVFAVHAGNPYRDPPSTFSGDPSFRHVSESWRNTVSPYGPGWQYLSVVPTAIAGRSAERAQLAFRILALLGVLAAVAGVARATRNPAAVAFVGWNPLLSLHFAGGGHNDAWLAALLALAAVSRGPRGGAAWAGATFFKGFPAILVPLVVAQARFRVRRSFWIALVGATIILAGTASALFGTAWVSGALEGAHGASGLGGVRWLEMGGLRYRYAVAVGALVFAIGYLVMLIDTWRTGRGRLAATTALLCITTPQLRPWYAIWAVALAGAEEDALGAAAAFALTSYLLLADAVSI